MRHLKKFENFDFKREDEEERKLIVPNVELEDDKKDDEEKKEDAGADEDNMKLEKFSAFNEKKKATPQQKARDAFAKRIKGEKSDKKDDKKDDKKEDDAKGKTPKTAAEKKLAAKFPPEDKITKGDFIKTAIDNKKKKESKEK